jgi:hypothetical protein
MKKTKKAFKVLEMRCSDDFDDEEHYFATKQLALRFLADEIERREYGGGKDGLPDRDIYDTRKDNRIHSMVINREWEKVAPYFNLYLSEISMITAYRRHERGSK